jgi:hypothetical protein
MTAINPPSGQCIVPTYKYHDLDERTKERVREHFCNWYTSDEWLSSVYEDAKTVGALMGIDIADIYFSGFSSQGDGACFTGFYEYRKGAAKAIRSHAPNDTELQRIANDLQALQRSRFYRLTARAAHSGRYYHEQCTDIDVSNDADYADADTDAALCSILRDYMRWIYRQLEAEYDYLTSEEYIAELIAANDYDFDEDGNII